jgi:hypothetical protein
MLILSQYVTTEFLTLFQPLRLKIFDNQHETLSHLNLFERIGGGFHQLTNQIDQPSPLVRYLSSLVMMLLDCTQQLPPSTLTHHP